MKHIDKQSEPVEVTDWKVRNPHATFKDLRHEHSFPGAVAARLALRAALLTEQKGLCCYCETRIDNGDFHIEHFRPKDPALFPYLQLTYDNLHACCRKNAPGGPEEYCGHKKANEFSDLLVSPLETDCGSHFRYDAMGGIFANDERGRETISILKLDSVLLCRSRKNLIEEFEDMTEAEFGEEVAHHLNPDANPLGEFYTTIEYLHTHGLLH